MPHAAIFPSPRETRVIGTVYTSQPMALACGQSIDKIPYFVSGAPILSPTVPSQLPIALTTHHRYRVPYPLLQYRPAALRSLSPLAIWSRKRAGSSGAPPLPRTRWLRATAQPMPLQRKRAAPRRGCQGPPNVTRT